MGVDRLRLFFILMGILLITVVSMDSFANPQADYYETNRNPFEDYLPKEEKEEGEISEEVVEVHDYEWDEQLISDLDIQGIMWGTEEPAAIINDEIYYEGSYILNKEGEIKEIEQGKIIILYKGREYKKGVSFDIKGNL